MNVHLTYLLCSVEAAEWYHRCNCIDCREQATHSVARGLADNACAARKSCDVNGASQTRKRSKSDLFFHLVRAVRILLETFWNQAFLSVWCFTQLHLLDGRIWRINSLFFSICACILKRFSLQLCPFESTGGTGSPDFSPCPDWLFKICSN